MSVDRIADEILNGYSFQNFRKQYRTAIDYENDDIADFDLVSVGVKYRMRAQKLHFYDPKNHKEVMKDIESINKRLSVMVKFYSCRSLLKYQHDNFSMKCHVLEGSNDSKIWYLISLSEYGVSVEQLLKENRFENTEQNVLKLAIDVCKALKAFHDEGETHMYITPENIFLGANGRYKLGRAAVVSDERRLDSSGMLYDGTYDRQSDIYMFGKCLSYIVSNLPGNMFSNRTGSKKISRIVERACDISKYERYMTIDEIITDIESISRKNKPPVYMISAAAAFVVTAGIVAAVVISGHKSSPSFSVVSEKVSETVTEEPDEKSVEKPDEATAEKPEEFEGLNIKFGDINNDGKIDTVDSSKLLSVYSQAATSGRKLSDVEMAVYDINADGVVDSSDAGFILKYYSLKATGKAESFKDFINEQSHSSD
ncbi:MAG: hypothetical protein IJM19_03190 [Ruminococcus sp.]|nr:hypothetical protein [Ruminococcus sp.]